MFGGGNRTIVFTGRMCNKMQGDCRLGLGSMFCDESKAGHGLAQSGVVAHHRRGRYWISMLAVFIFFFIIESSLSFVEIRMIPPLCLSLSKQDYILYCLSRSFVRFCPNGATLAMMLRGDWLNCPSRRGMMQLWAVRKIDFRGRG